MKSATGRLLSGLAFALAGAVAAMAAPGPQPHRKLSDEVSRRAARGGASPVDVIVRFRQAPGNGDRAWLRKLGGRFRRQLHGSRWTALRLPARAVKALQNNPRVEFIAIDARVSRAMDYARPAAGAPGPTEPESLLTGAGVTVAVLDSGVAPHPDLQLIAAVDFVRESVPGVVTIDPMDGTDPEVTVTGFDPNGHGTHVAGILAGRGGPDGLGKGIAPGASLVSVRALDGSGGGNTSDVIRALQWVVAHKNEYGIRVLNMSLGHPVFEPAAQDPLVEAVEAAWDAGIVVVCSAGNNGRNGHGTISSPCNSRKVITVGALNDRNTLATDDDTVTTYSSRGPTRYDLTAKPDLVAPGNRIVSARSPGSHVDVLHPERRVDDLSRPDPFERYEMSGTSMASPVVAGTVALMLEQDPGINPATVKARLMLSARKPAAGDPFATGAGALDILAALRTAGQVLQSPSPLVFPDPVTGQLGVENTAALWSDATFSITALWPSAVLWTESTEPEPAVVWSYAVLWTDSEMWGDATLWTDAVIWTDTTLWVESILWTDSFEDDDVDAEATWVDDP